MATKQEKAVDRAVAREKRMGKTREEKHILWFLVALILLLLYLLMAQYKGWWPYSHPKLGSAFYTNISAAEGSQAGADMSGSGSSGGGSGGGQQGGGSGGGGGGGSSAGSGGILGFAATIDTGDTKGQVSGQATGLGQNCAVVVSANTNTSTGKQEVCTYTQGDKIVTVTYLNDRVISASKSGF